MKHDSKQYIGWFEKKMKKGNFRKYFPETFYNISDCQRRQFYAKQKNRIIYCAKHGNLAL